MGRSSKRVNGSTSACGELASSTRLTRSVLGNTRSVLPILTVDGSGIAGFGPIIQGSLDGTGFVGGSGNEQQGRRRHHWRGFVLGSLQRSKSFHPLMRSRLHNVGRKELDGAALRNTLSLTSFTKYSRRGGR